MKGDPIEDSFYDFEGEIIIRKDLIKFYKSEFPSIHNWRCTAKTKMPILLKLSDLPAMGITLNGGVRGMTFNSDSLCWEQDCIDNEGSYGVDLSGFDSVIGDNFDIYSFTGDDSNSNTNLMEDVLIDETSTSDPERNQSSRTEADEKCILNYSETWPYVHNQIIMVNEEMKNSVTAIYLEGIPPTSVTHLHLNDNHDILDLNNIVSSFPSLENELDMIGSNGVDCGCSTSTSATIHCQGSTTIPTGTWEDSTEPTKLLRPLSRSTPSDIIKYFFDQRNTDNDGSIVSTNQQDHKKNADDLNLNSSYNIHTHSTDNECKNTPVASFDSSTISSEVMAPVTLEDTKERSRGNSVVEGSEEAAGEDENWDDIFEGEINILKLGSMHSSHSIASLVSNPLQSPGAGSDHGSAASTSGGKPPFPLPSSFFPPAAASTDTPLSISQTSKSGEHLLSSNSSLGSKRSGLRLLRPQDIEACETVYRSSSSHGAAVAVGSGTGPTAAASHTMVFDQSKQKWVYSQSEGIDTNVNGPHKIVKGKKDDANDLSWENHSMLNSSTHSLTSFSSHNSSKNIFEDSTNEIIDWGDDEEDMNKETSKEILKETEGCSSSNSSRSSSSSSASISQGVIAVDSENENQNNHSNSTSRSLPGSRDRPEKEAVNQLEAASAAPGAVSCSDLFMQSSSRILSEIPLHFPISCTSSVIPSHPYPLLTQHDIINICNHSSDIIKTGKYTRNCDRSDNTSEDESDASSHRSVAMSAIDTSKDFLLSTDQLHHILQSESLHCQLMCSFLHASEWRKVVEAGAQRLARRTPVSTYSAALSLSRQLQAAGGVPVDYDKICSKLMGGEAASTSTAGSPLSPQRHTHTSPATSSPTSSRRTHPFPLAAPSSSVPSRHTSSATAGVTATTPSPSLKSLSSSLVSQWTRSRSSSTTTSKGEVKSPGTTPSSQSKILHHPLSSSSLRVAAWQHDPSTPIPALPLSPLDNRSSPVSSSLGSRMVRSGPFRGSRHRCKDWKRGRVMGQALLVSAQIGKQKLSVFKNIWEFSVCLN